MTLQDAINWFEGLANYLRRQGRSEAARKIMDNLNLASLLVDYMKSRPIPDATTAEKEIFYFVVSLLLLLK